MMKNLVKIVFFLAVVVLFSACQSPAQQAANQAAEKAIEQASGGQTDVNIERGSADIKTDGGRVQVGEGTELPADFPKDVYVYEGKIASAVTEKENNSFSVSIQTDKSLAEVKAAYEEKFADDGWKQTGIMDFGNAASITAEKDNRTASVMISSEQGQTTIVLTTSTEE